MPIVHSQPASAGLPPGADLQALRQGANQCRDCPIGAYATQAVFGEGPLRPALMLVGEQPGDREDIMGRPFVGPAGRLLDQALAQLAWPREALYLTNAVKHFKFQLRGKRRLHKSPAQHEVEVCLQWLDRELELLRPPAAVALGATAARAMTGQRISVMRERGRWVQRADGLRVLITLHPSALLRGRPEDRDAAFRQWLNDLRHADTYVAKAG